MEVGRLSIQYIYILQTKFMEKLLVVNNVSKTYGDYKALTYVSIEVEKGSIFGLLGPNGAGKTTLIRIINQITMPDTGSIILDGEPLQPHHIKVYWLLARRTWTLQNDESRGAGFIFGAT